MRNLLRSVALLVGILVLTSACIADQSTPFALQAQLQQTISSCGKPKKNFLGPINASYSTADRILDYRDYSLVKTHSRTPWSFRCADDNYSFTHSKAGACSHHGGIAQPLN